MVKGIVIVIKCWENLQTSLEKFFELKKHYILKMKKQLEDAFTASKSYWTIINQLLYNKVILTIPPLLAEWSFVLDFNKKANFINNFFSPTCAPISNASTLPYFSYRTDSRINSFQAAVKEILLTIKSLAIVDSVEKSLG